MNREQILEAIQSLAKSQGFYGRLLQQINEAEEDVREGFLSELEFKNFKDTVDLVLYLEA